MNITVVQRITLNVTNGKKVTPRVFEKTVELPIKGLVFQPEEADLNPLQFVKDHAFGSTVWVFPLSHFDGKTAHYHPQKCLKNSAFLRDIHHWGFVEVVSESA